MARLLNVRAIPRHTFKPLKWVNGKGTTHEIVLGAHSPTSTSRSPFAWRLSMAELAPPGGAFSVIEGVDRVLTLLEGDLALKVGKGDEEYATLRRSEPFCFPGDVETDSIVHSSGLDLNIMHCRETIRAQVAVMGGRNSGSNCEDDDQAWEVAAPRGRDDAVFAVSLGGADGEKDKGCVVEVMSRDGTTAAADLGPLDAAEVCFEGRGKCDTAEKLRLRARGGNALFVSFRSR